MIRAQVAILCLAASQVLGDLPPGTRRNTYLPPVPTKGYNYERPSVPFPGDNRPTIAPPTGPTRPTPSFPVGPTRPIPSFPTGPARPTPAYPTRPTGPNYTPGPRPTPYPGSNTRPTPAFPDYTGQPSGPNGNTLTPGHDDHHHDHHHHHEPGMPFDFNYAVKDDAFGNDYSHNAVSDGDVVRGEYRVALPDGRLQIVRYTADWQHGFNAQVSYEGTPRYDIPKPSTFNGY